ncbi:MAG: DUF1847 domain-containing protein [Chloroflexi bacterium]|nr:DUF1847 domain-containing protein [Chloroflexota bacterium]
MSRCSECGIYACYSGKVDDSPGHCPMRLETLPSTPEIQADPEVLRALQVSARIEASGYMRWTRVEETMEFARGMGFTRLGLAFCVGLRRETATLTKILTTNGFEVISIMCKSGATPKETIGLRDEEKVRPGNFEAMCNPVSQAKYLNARETQLNIQFGLCVGHDSLFNKYSDALVTCLVAKDRVLAHNPIGALYCSHGYYRKALFDNHKPPAASK